MKPRKHKILVNGILLYITYMVLVLAGGMNERRTEFWKSNPRKYCDFCDCWIADNKISRDIHDKGKRHLENVKKKIEEVRKKGTKDAEHAEFVSDSLREMEEAALRALKDDIRKDPSMAAQYGVKIKQKEPEATSVPEASTSEPGDSKPEKLGDSKAETNTQPSDEHKTVASSGEWKEDWTADGYVYYWHTLTGESTWVKPEGYVASWERSAETEEKDTDISVQQESGSPKPQTSNEGKNLTDNDKEEEGKKVPDKSSDQENSDKESEQSGGKEKEVPLPETEQTSPPDVAISQPTPRPSAYGKWEEVSHEQEELPDWNLPTEQKVQVERKVIVMEEPKIKFREKKVESLGNEFVPFKKRKKNLAAQRNIKRKEDDS